MCLSYWLLRVTWYTVVILATRTWALWERSRRILVVLALLATVRCQFLYVGGPLHSPRWPKPEGLYRSVICDNGARDHHAGYVVNSKSHSKQEFIVCLAVGPPLASIPGVEVCQEWPSVVKDGEIVPYLVIIIFEVG